MASLDSKLKLDFPCGCVFTMSDSKTQNSIKLCKLHKNEFECQLKYNFNDVPLSFEMKYGLRFSPIKEKPMTCKLGLKIMNKIDSVKDGHSCLRHYTCRSCKHVHLRKGKN